MRNKFLVRDDYVEILIKNKNFGSMFFKIDLDDFEKVSKYSWWAYYNKNNNSFYVTGNDKINKKNIRVHRLLTDCPSSLIVDHINHDTLDNRKKNLRVCDYTKNAQNRKGATKRNITGVLGVRYRKCNNKYEARITVNGKLMNLGNFTTIEEASDARKKAENIYF